MEKENKTPDKSLRPAPLRGAGELHRGAEKAGWASRGRRVARSPTRIAPDRPTPVETSIYEHSMAPRMVAHCFMGWRVHA